MEIKNGMRFKPRKSGDQGGRFDDRVLTVKDADKDEHGRVEVLSHNRITGSTRIIAVNAARLLSSAYKAIPVAILALVAGCVTAPAKPNVIGCDREVHNTIPDAKGNPAAELRFCYLDNGTVAWTGQRPGAAAPRPLTPVRRAARPVQGIPPKKPTEQISPANLTPEEAEFIRRGRAQVEQMRDAPNSAPASLGSVIQDRATPQPLQAP